MATFWDQVDVTVAAGNAGNGLISFRRELGEAKGGPDGGDGGDGGSVIFVADPGVNTLAEFARRRKFAAKPGQPGGKGKRHGKSAEDLVLKVPPGTVIRSGDRIVADLTEVGSDVVAARGGRGGFGNAHFTSSRRQAPRQAERGEPGEELPVSLELKLVADIGLVGVPSVGKSTLLARITAAKPKIADYPFTTTVPQLGIAEVAGQRVTVADIPGLIEGAHQGKGLGDAFLRHIDRTKVIIHMLDATSADPAKEYRQIKKELRSFNPTLVQKPEVVALNKVDTFPAATAKRLVQKVSKDIGTKVLPISAVAGTGVLTLLTTATKLAAQHQPEPVEQFARLTLADLAPEALSVQRSKDGFAVRGARLERLAQQTDFTNWEATERFWWTARRFGLDTQLEKLGAEPEATILIGKETLAWPGSS